VVSAEEEREATSEGRKRGRQRVKRGKEGGLSVLVGHQGVARGQGIGHKASLPISLPPFPSTAGSTQDSLPPMAPSSPSSCRPYRPCWSSILRRRYGSLVRTKEAGREGRRERLPNAVRPIIFLHPSTRDKGVGREWAGMIAFTHPDFLSACSCPSFPPSLLPPLPPSLPPSLPPYFPRTLSRSCPGRVVHAGSARSLISRHADDYLRPAARWEQGGEGGREGGRGGGRGDGEGPLSIRRA